MAARLEREERWYQDSNEGTCWSVPHVPPTAAEIAASQAAHEAGLGKAAAERAARTHYLLVWVAAGKRWARRDGSLVGSRDEAEPMTKTECAALARRLPRVQRALRSVDLTGESYLPISL